MDRTKPIVLLAVLLTMALCLTIFVVTQAKKVETDPGTTPLSTTESQIQNENPAETTTQATTIETTMETTEATTEATTEPTEETTEATTEETTEATEEPTGTGVDIVSVAKAQLGKSYVYGAAGPDDFDSSGLTQYCYKVMGINIPRSVQGQADAGEPVEKEDLQPGDLVFFCGDTKGKVQIVGIYIGDGKFIGAFNSNRPVVEVDMTTSYYISHYETARRYY